MKIPKYIDDLIDKRMKLAESLACVDYKLSEWLDKNEIPVAPEDYRTGVEMYANPYESAERIRQAIEEAGGTKC